MLRSSIALLALLTAVLTACSTEDGSLDGRDDSFTGSKADGFCADEGSVDAAGILALVNDEATSADLLDAPTADGGVGLDSRAADGIVTARPFASLADLDDVPFVGPASCLAIRRFACDVRGLCSTCQADQATPPPDTTTFDGACPDLLFAIGAADLAEKDEVGDIDVGTRCESLDELARLAFDIVASKTQQPLDELSGDDYAMDVRRLTASGHELAIVDIDDFSGLLWFVVFADGRPIVTWSSDGLSDIAEWYCGTRPGNFTDSPSELCMQAFFEIPCSQARSASEVSTSAAGAAAAGLGPAEVHALEDYIARAGLGDQVELDVSLDRCAVSDSSRVGISHGGSPSLTYTVAERPGGPMLLSVADGSQNQLLCTTFDE